MDASEVLVAADRNMVGAWQGITEHVAGPRCVVDRHNLLLLSVGEPLAIFNPAFVRGPLEDPEATLDQVAEHYGKLGMPFVLIFREEVVPGLGEACNRRAMVEHWQAPLMVLDPIPEAPSPPAGLEIVPIHRAQLHDYVSVLGDGFGMPGSMARRIFSDWLIEMDGFTGFLGLIDGVPVATSGLYSAHGVAGVYNVATLPEHRNRGIGAAMTWAAADAGRRAGLTVSVLQASRVGEPVYEAMGYRTPAHYRQFEAR